jgi:hypothetical protein
VAIKTMMKKIKFQIKSIAGAILFEWEQEDNTMRTTVEKFLAEKEGSLIKDANLSGLDLSNIDFSNSKFDNSKFDNSKFYNSQFDNSKFYNSKFDNSQFYNSQFYNSQFDNSQFYNSQFDNSQFYNSQFDSASINNLKASGALEPVRFDFFGRLLVLKNEVAFLKQALIEGRVDGSTYTKECSCFMGTAARAKKCSHTELPGIKPDASSDTERWFMGISKGDTPENSEIVKLTLEWIEEFEFYLKA